MEANICDEMTLGIHMAIENDVVTNGDDLVSERKEKIKQEDNLEMELEEDNSSNILSNELDAKEAHVDGKPQKCSITYEEEEEEEKEACSEEEDVDLMEELHYAYKENEKIKKRIAKQKAQIQEFCKAKKESNEIIKNLKVQLEEAKQKRM
ncbi:uncharacterized protein LOC131874446 [Cryptomeria japonica]|uniref:uncharacterized protein LOC131874446 n=1 Tax=Cryptomeria japonica TaxID=3369 RepID=UPI0027D9E3B4|nr:uncharacterized protein LOC131874446 [Cryptomeria japonica]